MANPKDILDEALFYHSLADQYKAIGRAQSAAIARKQAEFFLLAYERSMSHALGSNENALDYQLSQLELTDRKEITTMAKKPKKTKKASKNSKKK